MTATLCVRCGLRPPDRVAFNAYFRARLPFSRGRGNRGRRGEGGKTAQHTSRNAERNRQITDMTARQSPRDDNVIVISATPWGRAVSRSNWSRRT